MWKFDNLGIVIPFLSSLQKVDNLLENLQKAQDLNWISEVILVVDWREDTQSIQNLKAIKNLNLKKIQILIDMWGSAGSARNAGLKVCDSAWVHFCDSDDLIMFEGLSRLFQETVQKEASIGIASYVEEYSRTKKEQLRSLNLTNENSSLCQVVKAPGIWRFIFNHNVIDGIQFPHSNMGEDQVFISRSFAKVKNIHLSSAVVYKYLKDNLDSLTNQLIDIGQLRISSSLTLESVDSSSKYKWFQELLYVNQTLGLLKRGNTNLRIKLLFDLLVRVLSMNRGRIFYINLARILFRP